MHKFKDGLDQQWQLEFGISEARMIRKKLGLDILNPEHAGQIRSSLLDRLSMVFLLCEEQAKSLDITMDQFDARMYGEGIANGASNSLMRTLADFFRSLGQLHEAMLTEKSLEIMEFAQKRNAKMFETGELESMMNLERDGILATLQGNDGSTLQNLSPSQDADPKPSE